MKKKSVEQEVGFINSSYVVIFHTLLVAAALFLVSVFPSELRGDALIAAVAFPALLFWSMYFIRQIVDASHTFMLIAGFMFIVATLSLLNAVYGELSADYLPIIYTEVPFFATLSAGLSGPVGLIYAGTILSYGAYVYAVASLLAMAIEGVYGASVRRLMPAMIRSKLKKIDGSVDRAAIRISDKYFIVNDRIGLVVCSVPIVIFAVMYVYLLIR